mgnify:CR=1 FL=1
MKLDLHFSSIETSKLIILSSYLISLALTVVVIVGTFLSFDMSNVTQIALISYGEVTASNIFYFKKSGRENIFKNLPKELLDRVDINNLV